MNCVVVQSLVSLCLVLNSLNNLMNFAKFSEAAHRWPVCGQSPFPASFVRCCHLAAAAYARSPDRSDSAAAAARGLETVGCQQRENHAGNRDSEKRVLTAETTRNKGSFKS